MTPAPFSDTEIVESWRLNASAWTIAVREGQIESRKQVTDQAIVDTLLGLSPRSVLDIGCGEGWLARELAVRNIPVVGTDVVPRLIDEAQHAGGGDFRVMSHEEIAAGKLKVSVDVVVSNFALLGKESVEGVFQAVPSLLNAYGTFIVQTLHPAMACGDFPYQDGWREGSWAGFSADFANPAPWYFRTLESWIKLFVDNGLRPREIREPIHPKTHKPVSVMILGDRANY